MPTAMPWPVSPRWSSRRWGEAHMLSAAILAELQALLGVDRVFADAATLALYASDETPKSCLPDAVLFPTSHDDVVAIVQLANRHRLAPVARLANLVNAIDALGKHHGVPIVSFGHAGNGNLHVNLMVHADDADEMTRARNCRDALIEAVIGLGGSLSGEHGIGSEKRHYVGRELDAATLAMMRDVKRLFDPLGLLNPGKKLPDEQAAR